MQLHVVISLEGGVLTSVAARSTKEAAIALAQEWARRTLQDPAALRWEDGDDEVVVLEGIEVDGAPR